MTNRNRSSFTIDSAQTATREETQSQDVRREPDAETNQAFQILHANRQRFSAKAVLSAIRKARAD